MLDIKNVIMSKRSDVFKQYNISAVYGIYLNDELVYIGSSTNCIKRFYSHKRKIVMEESKRCAWKDYTLVYNELRRYYRNGDKIEFGIIDKIDDNVVFLRALERAYIRILKPRFNVSNH